MADRCYHCHHTMGNHDPACPEIVPANKDDFNDGWVCGRQNRPCPPGATVAFQMGWANGEVALEEYENGYDPRFDE